MTSPACAERGISKLLRRWTCALPLALFYFALPRPCFSMDAADSSFACVEATVVTAPASSIQEKSAIRMLLDESAKRTGDRWKQSVKIPDRRSDNSDFGCWIVAANRKEIADELPATLLHRVTSVDGAPEGFALTTLRWNDHPLIVIEGADDRGVLFGVGYLLRTMKMLPKRALIADGIRIAEHPVQPIRSHQMGYRNKNNTYDAWTLRQFEQQIRDLAIFGANTIQLIAPESDDTPTSPLFPAPPLDTIAGISRILDRYGLNCDIYYPEMEADYARSSDVARELERFHSLMQKLPRVDAVYIPGGDPGHTPPDVLFPLMERESAILRVFHPGARFYVSAQGMNAEHYEDFYRWMNSRPRWLDGVFFGPQSRDSFARQRERIPRQYPMIFYPDIAHTMHAQFPVPDWDPVFALTEGREPIDPRPVDESVIFHHFLPLNIGFVTYSEGVNDDVNKTLWSAWGWNPDQSSEEILRQYARLFVGPEFETVFTQSIFDLERDWRGALATNAQIPKTLDELTAIEQNPDAPQRNWRLESALYRANYDALLQVKLSAEQGQEQIAMQALEGVSDSGAEAAMKSADAALRKPDPVASIALRKNLFQLAQNLFEDVGIQLSVPLYKAENWERGANLDRADIPLNNRVWLAREFTRIRSLDSEATKKNELLSIAHWDTPLPGTMHDDLGAPDKEPHLVRGVGFEDDPEMYRTAIDGVADRIPTDGWRWSELSYAETLYEQPLRLRYTGLDPNRSYRLRVYLAGEDYALQIRLLANAPQLSALCGEHTSNAMKTCSDLRCEPTRNCFELQSAEARKTNPQRVEFAIPAAAIRQGKLEVEWLQPYGEGGSGRGNQVAEVWLVPEP